MHRNITRQSRRNLRRASDKTIPNQAPEPGGRRRDRMAKITSWVKVQSDSHRKGESDRITARSAVQIALRKHEGHCPKAVAFTCLENRPVDP